MNIIDYTESYINKIRLGFIPTKEETKTLIFKYMLDDEVMIVPDKYKDLYNQISSKMKDLGEEIIRDCTASCKCKNTPLINCWFMFQSLVAAYTLKMEKQEKMFEKFIIEQLKLI